jgi:hypothetical protein
VSKNNEVTEKPTKPQKLLDRRFCVAPMMDSKRWGRKALQLK